MFSEKGEETADSRGFCTCPHRAVLPNITLVSGPGRTWTFISGLAGGCSVQLSYEATMRTPGILRSWRSCFAWVFAPDMPIF